MTGMIRVSQTNFRQGHHAGRKHAICVSMSCSMSIWEDFLWVFNGTMAGVRMEVDGEEQDFT